MIEEQPANVSVAIIRHRVKRGYENPGLIGKIRLAANVKPALIITPQFSFLNERYLDNIYELLTQESPSTVLVTAKSNALIKTPEPELGPLEGLDYQVLVYPYNEKKFLALDFLISFGEGEPVEIVRDMANLKENGYLIRLINSKRTYAIKNITKRVDNKDISLPEQVPLTEHKHMNFFDLYNLKFT